MSKLSKTEQETIILFNEQDSLSSIFTHNKRLITKLDKLCKSNPKNYQLETDAQYKEWGCKTFIIPKKMISIRTKTREEKKLTSEQKENLKENLKKARETKKKD